MKSHLRSNRGSAGSPALCRGMQLYSGSAIGSCKTGCCTSESNRPRHAGHQRCGRSGLLQYSECRKTCVLLNPRGRGSARKKLEALKPSLADLGVEHFFETRSSGDERQQAQAAIEQGFETIIVFGGDGTCSGVANAILERSPKCRLCVMPVGTGNDFAKTLGVIDRSPIQVCELAVNGVATRIDVGVTGGQYFLNSCGFGFDASVLEASQRVRFLR